MSATSRGVERLALLASAVAGRDLSVIASEPGDLAWTDGSTIYVDPTSADDEQLRAAAVQACLLAAGSLDPLVLRRLPRRSSVIQRYVTLEGHRVLAQNEWLLPTAARTLIDRDLAASTSDADASVVRAKGKDPLPRPPPCFGTIRVAEVLRSPRVSDAAGDDRTPGARPSVAESDEIDALDRMDQLDTDAPDLARLLESPVGGGGPLGKLLRRLLRSSRGRRSQGPLGGDAPRGRSPSATGRPAVGFVRHRPTTTDSEPMAPDQPGRWIYPEWDVRRTAYRPDWCVVHDVDPPSDGEPWPLADVPAMRRSLARLGLGLDRYHRRLDGDDVDIDALVELRVETLAGSSPEPAVYIESLPRRRDLSVLILLDVSGSASQAGSHGRSVHDHQRTAVAALATALHDLGDRVALQAFASQGRKSVRMTRLKDFGDALDGRVAQRLGGLVPSAFTRLGAAIRHGAAVLENDGGTDRRLLIVVSDGFAYDHGYEGQYGQADARMALAEARRWGIGCLCLSVGADADSDELRRVFGSAAHASVGSTDRLPAIVGPLFDAAIRSAEARRRRNRRTVRSDQRLQIEGARR